MSRARTYLTSGIRISLNFSRYDPDRRRYVAIGRTRRAAFATEREAERFLRHIERSVRDWVPAQKST